MERLIEAMGKRYNAHPRVAFIQLGLLGFWGEWHTYQHEKWFASDATQQRILAAYRRAFPDKQLMARYGDGACGKHDWLGFHDDMFPEDTDNGEDWSFLARLRRAGRADSWRRNIIGGEMVPDAALRWMGKDFEHTMAMIDRSHFSWVGPYGPALEDRQDDQFIENCRKAVRRMGYQFRLTEIRYRSPVVSGDQVVVQIQGVNEGVAPFYYPWPVELALLDAHGQPQTRLAASVDIRKWLPGEFVFKVTDKVKAKPGKYRLAIGIIDPWTGQPGVQFAHQAQKVASWHVLGEIEVMGH